MLTPDQIAEITRLIQDHIREERERTAKAAGLSCPVIWEKDSPEAPAARMLADFARRMRVMP